MSEECTYATFYIYPILVNLILCYASFMKNLILFVLVGLGIGDGIRKICDIIYVTRCLLN